VSTSAAPNTTETIGTMVELEVAMEAELSREGTKVGDAVEAELPREGTKVGDAVGLDVVEVAVVVDVEDTEEEEPVEGLDEEESVEGLNKEELVEGLDDEEPVEGLDEEEVPPKRGSLATIPDAPRPPTARDIVRLNIYQYYKICIGVWVDGRKKE